VIDLGTRYLGLDLPSPLVMSASPLCEEIDNIRRAEDAGAGAVVLHSLFEEQIDVESHDLDHHLSHGTHSFAEALSYFPDMTTYNLGPKGYLEHIRKAKAAVDIPVIASLNGVSSGGWIEYARRIEQAGADALELNVYFVPTDTLTSGAEIERRYLDLVHAVRLEVTIPVAVKLPHFFSAIPNMALRLDETGIDGLVLFNRFYQPDLDIERLEVVPNLILSSSAELRLRLRWVAILYGHVHADLAVTGGVHTAEDVLKSMMAGASVAMMTSALLVHGVEHLARVRASLTAWMEDHEYTSVNQMHGSMSQQHVADPAAFERANYLRVLRSYALRPAPGRAAAGRRRGVARGSR
jgi:dihydroorotate dehydrogenase (fumarate)